MRALLFVGLPGCGKSTLAREFPEFVEINRDQIREQLFGTRRHHGHEGAVSREHARRIRRHAARGEEILISDTHSQRRCRKAMIRMLQDLGYQVEVLVFDVGEATCRKRNRERSEPVPAEVLERMGRRLRLAPPSLSEGMDRLRLIRQEGAGPLFTPGEIGQSACESPRDAPAPSGRARVPRPPRFPDGDEGRGS